MKEWVRVIEEFQFKCHLDNQHVYRESSLVHSLKAQLKD